MDMSRLNSLRIVAALFLLWLPGLVTAQPTAEVSAVPILGSVGLAQTQENSCIAVWVPVGNKISITGIKWYNNDGTVVFPEVLVQSGSAEYPVSLPDAVPVATSVTGQSGAWSEVAFSSPVGSTSGGLYVIFRLPSGAHAQADGAGGGPALGYTHAAEGYPGWMSADGEDWSPVHPDYGFAVRPILTADGDALMFKSGRIGGGTKGDEAAGQVLAVTMLKPAMPNPFNPQTTLNFSLKADATVELAVFNLRGDLVRQLLSERRSAGEHSVVWNGRDRSGSALASGVYLARFVAGDVVMTQRLVLVQ
jgi:hypothetical protein